MAFLSSFYPQPVVAGTTEGTFAEGDHSHELDELDASGIVAGKVLTANGLNAALWEDSTGQVEEAPEDGIIYGRKDADWVDITEPANLQVRRGTAAEVAAITPLEGEPVWSTDTKALVIGDGSTVGGILVSEFPMDGDTASGSTAGKIRANNKTNALGGGPPRVLGNARGNGSIDLQMSRTQAAQVASGSFSVILGGESNTASGLRSTVINGSSATASGSDSLAYGAGSNSTATNSIALIGATASGSNSIAIGASTTASGATSIATHRGIADRIGMFARGISTITNFVGRCQIVEFGMRGRTANDTPTEMTLGSTNKLTIPENVALFGTIEVAAIEPTTATEAAHLIRKFAIQNLGGTTTLIGTVTTVGTDYESDAGYDITLTADDAGDFLKVEVTGDSAKILRWVAAVRGVEIAIALIAGES
jgi:hypothetical protein